MKDIARPYKSAWEYRAVWRMGDEFIGKRWGVLNISHGIFVADFSIEIDAKRDIRARKKRHLEAQRAANRVARGKTELQIRQAMRDAADEKKRKKHEEYLALKRAAKYFKNIPFPA